MSLSHVLAVDVLTIVASYLDGVYIVRLWLTGDVVLRVKLARCVQKFRLVWNGVQPFQWPSVISRLPNIVDLELKNHPSITKWKCTGVEMQKIPRKLVRLCLGFPNADSVFLDDNGDRTEKLAQLKELRLEQLGYAGTTLLRALPRHLEYLSIFADSSAFGTDIAQRTNLGWVLDLPKSLKRVEGITKENLHLDIINEAVERSKHILMDHLANIEHWNVDANIGPSLFQLLPRTCRSIVSGNLHVRTPTQASAKHLPPTLTALEIQCKTLTPTFVSFLPQTLTWLLLDSPDCHSLLDLGTILPRLEHFRHRMMEGQPTWNDLPENLTTLHINYTPNWDAVAASNITNLTVPKIKPDLGWESLPRNLEVLETNSCPDLWTAPDFGLTKLQSFKCAQTALSRESIVTLPKSLTSLHVPNWPEIELLSALPPTLTYFRALPLRDKSSQNALPLLAYTKEPIVLPLGLVNFEFGFPQGTSANALANLRHLCHLEVLQIGSLTDPGDVDVLKYLPTNVPISRTELQGASTSESLSKTDGVMNLQQNEAMGARPDTRKMLVKDIITKTRTSLIHVTVKCRNTLTSEHLNYLPTILRTFSVRSPEPATIRDEDLEKLPPGLTNMLLPRCPQLTPESSDFLRKYAPRLSYMCTN